MSRIIHPAFLLRKNTDLFKASEELREVLLPYLSNKFRREAVKLAIREFDSVEKIDGGDKFSTFLKTSLNELRRSLGGEIEGYDKYDLMAFHSLLAFKATFLWNKSRDEVYFLFHGDSLDDTGEAMVLNLDFIESDFSYWNSSDSQVATIGEEEWYRRRDSWEETLDKNLGIPQQGITAEFFEKWSSYNLTKWEHFEGNADLFIDSLTIEERFRRLVFHDYLEKLRGVYPDLNIMEAVNDSWQFLNPKKERDYDSLPFAEEQKLRLDDAIEFAEGRVAAFPLVF